MLSVDELITHMKNKGIKFEITSENEAKNYLHKNNNYFKLTSYRKNYLKITSGINSGKYENLDFAYLVELARIDVELRHLLLTMCLDIEHFLKVYLIKEIEQNKDQDGYTIVTDYLFDSSNGSVKNRLSSSYSRISGLLNKYKRNNNNPYCGGLIDKYNNELPIWAFVEIISFGDLLYFAQFISEKCNCSIPVDRGTLDRVRQIRNAAAHSNCIINDLHSEKTNDGKILCNNPVYITNFCKKAGISNDSMRKKLSNRRISQIVHLLYAYNIIVQSDNTRCNRLNELNGLISDRMVRHKEYFKSNLLLSSSYNFIKKISDYLQ